MILNAEDFLNEKAKYIVNYTKLDIKDHIKRFLKRDVEIDNISQKNVNFYNYSMNYLNKKYKKYNPLQDDQEGPADEDYMNILNKLNKSIT